MTNTDAIRGMGVRQSEGTAGVSRWLLFWGVALGGMAFDLATKAWMFARIGEPGTAPPVTLLSDILELQTNYNPGALWGLGSDMPHSSLFFAGLALLEASAICWWLFVRKTTADWRLTSALGLIMAGALGNCYDRVMLGHVRDFVHFHVDPIRFDCAIFNFGDNMLVAGAVILMLLALRPTPEPAPPCSADRSEGESTTDVPGSLPAL